MLPIYELATEYRILIHLIHGTADAIYPDSQSHLLGGGCYHSLDSADREETLHLVTRFATA